MNQGDFVVKIVGGVVAKYDKWRKPENLILIEGWARDGLTDEQIAHNIGISRSTLNDWKRKFSDISDTLKKGKAVVDYQVVNALLRRALGFKYKEVIKALVENPETGGTELTVVREVIKEALPDTTAQIFWLKNRCPDKWRDKTENIVENKSENEIKINIVSTKNAKTS